MMHPIYERLIELIEQDPSKLEELEDFIDEANEVASEEEHEALLLAINHAKKETLLVDLGKHLLGVNDEEDAMQDPMTMRLAGRYGQGYKDADEKMRLTRTQFEILKQVMEQERQRNE